ncbi:MAG: hypothetical protein R8M38_05960 [Mariprofundaceae bacterium]
MREYKISFSITPKKYVVWAVVLALLFAGGVALTLTKNGNHYLGIFIAFIMEQQTGYEFEVYGMDVQLQELRVSADKLIIKDKNGTWLSAQDLKLDWDYENLVGINCAIKSIESRSITVSAFPGDSFRILNNLQDALFTSFLSTDHLSIPLITFTPHALGEELKVKLNGSCDAVGRSRHYLVKGLSEVLTLDLTLQDFRGFKDEMESQGAYEKGEAPTTQAHAQLYEDAGGVVSSFLGFSESKSLHIEAFIPIRDRSIKGAIIKFDHFASSLMELSSFFDTNDYFHFTGHLSMRDDIQIDSFLVPANRYKFEVEFRPNLNWSLFDSVDVHIASKDSSEELFLSGSIGLWNQQYNLNFLANLPITSSLWQGVTEGLKSDIRALTSGSVKGAFRNPAIQANLDIYDIEHAAYRAKRIKASINVTNFFQSDAGTSTTGSLSLSGLSMYRGKLTAPITFSDLDASIKGEYSPNRKAVWKVESLEVEMGKNKLTAMGSYYPKNQYIDIKHILEVKRLPDGLFGQYKLPGSVIAKGNISGTWDNKQLKGEVLFSGRDMKSMPPFIGPSPSLDLTLFYNDATGYINFAADRFFSDGVAGVVSGRMGVHNGSMTGDGKFWALKHPLEKSASLERLHGLFSFEGFINDMTLSGSAGAEGVSPEGEMISDLRFDLHANGHMDELNGELRATYSQHGATITAHSPIVLGVLYSHLKQSEQLPLLKYRASNTIGVDK